MVRGFALFGVLLVNMYNFGSSSPIWTDGIDQLAFSVKRVLFETKSWRLFSLLFGFGFAMWMLRAEEKGGKLLPVYVRRLTVLFVMGMGHKLLYDGDILMLYAELGLLLVAFRNLPPKTLLILAFALLAVFPAERAVTTLRAGPAIVRLAAPDLDQARVSMELRRSTHPYSIGSVRDVMAVNAAGIPPNPLTDLRGSESSLAFFAMFLVGLYIGRRRLLHDVPKHLVLIRRVAGWGLAIGFLSMAGERFLHATAGYEVFSAQRATVIPQLLGDVLFAYGSTALSVGYAAVIVVLARQSWWKRILSPLGPVGRLALTVYLTQTLMFTTLFYGYAFGRVFRIGPAAVTVYASLFFVLQIVACGWWVRRFRFGPLEWVWRSLTYMQVQPLRLRTCLPTSRSPASE
jgi:uncharacterized protein